MDEAANFNNSASSATSSSSTSNVLMDEGQIEKWIDVCREKVGILKYLSTGCRLNGHLLSLIGHAEHLEAEVADAISAANALMASKTIMPATFCDPAITLSPLHVAVDRLQLEHALLRAQIATKRTSSYQFAAALQIFNRQYADVINGGELARMLNLLAEFYINHSSESWPVSYDTICRQKEDLQKVVTNFHLFRDNVKHLLRAGRTLKMMAPQNSANDLRRIDLKISDLHERLQEITDWVNKQQQRLKTAERDAKHFDHCWREMLAWIDEMLNEVNEMQANPGSAGINLKTLRCKQKRLRSEKQTRLAKCIRLADKLASKALLEGNSYDRQLITWQASTIKERFEQLENALEACELECSWLSREDARVRSIILQCKRIIGNTKSYLIKAKTNRLSSSEEAELVASLLKKAREMLNDSVNGVAALVHGEATRKQGERFEMQLVELSLELEKREAVIKQDFEAMADFFQAYQACRNLVADMKAYKATKVTFFDDAVIAQLQEKLDEILRHFTVIPNGADLRCKVTDEMASLFNDIEDLKTSVEQHSKRRQQARKQLTAMRRQMGINRSSFSEIARSVPATKTLRSANPKLKYAVLHELTTTKQKLQVLISASSLMQEGSLANNQKQRKQHHLLSLRRGASEGGGSTKQEPLCRYLDICEAAEARQLYLECTRLINKLSS